MEHAFEYEGKYYMGYQPTPLLPISALRTEEREAKSEPYQLKFGQTIPGNFGQTIQIGPYTDYDFQRTCPEFPYGVPLLKEAKAETIDRIGIAACQVWAARQARMTSDQSVDLLGHEQWAMEEAGRW